MQDGATPIRLLIVDDERGFTEVLSKRMTRRGLRVDTAASGEEAVRMLRTQDYDATIIDLKLESMDGVEILKVFKLLDPGLPILMLTGHGSETAVKASMRLGAADYLSKPVDFEALVAKVLKVARQGGDKA
ncbi:MAG: response regulator [Pseudomonadota bacterium]